MPHNFQANTFSPHIFRPYTLHGGAGVQSVTHSGWFRLLLTELQSAVNEADEIQKVAEEVVEQPKLTSHIVTPEEQKLLAKKRTKKRALEAKMFAEEREEHPPKFRRLVIPERIVSAYEAFGLPLIESINATRSELESLALQWKLQQESEEDEIIIMLLMAAH